MKQLKKNQAVRRTFWLAFAFYIIIGFEFFYMISPFAVYFYSIYHPGLDFINQNAALSWLNQIFLPHIVSETSSGLLNVLPEIGLIAAFGGFLIFCIGAAQVYYNKLAKKAVVTRGIYRFIRHPQYAALMVSGFGLLIVWPRYIALIAYITMLYLYYLLARVEEKECEEKFGSSYLDYKKQTFMFFPISAKLNRLNPMVPQNGFYRVIRLAAIYIFTLILSIGAANAVRHWSLSQLYSVYQDNSVVISVVRIEPAQLEKIIALALADEKVGKLIEKRGQSVEKTIHYVMPDHWSASEIPMRMIEGTPDHFDYHRKGKVQTVRVVLTHAVQKNDQDAKGLAIITNTISRLPLAEVLINVEQLKVLDVFDPIDDHQLKNIPLPVF